MTHPPLVQRHKDLSTQNKIADQFRLPPPVKTPPKSFGHNETPDVDYTSLAESAGFQFPKRQKRAIIVGKVKNAGAVHQSLIVTSSFIELTSPLMTRVSMMI